MPFYAVAVVVTARDHQELALRCEEYEKSSGKGNTKWRKTSYKARVAYLQSVCNDIALTGCLRVVIFSDVKQQFDSATQRGIATAILWQAPSTYTAYVYVDALAKSKRMEYRHGLKIAGVQMGGVKGIARDESNALIRLADALAGATRDALHDQHIEIEAVFTHAKKRGQVIVLTQ